MVSIALKVIAFPFVYINGRTISNYREGREWIEAVFNKKWTVHFCLRLDLDVDVNVHDGEDIDKENHDEEQFHIQPTENDKNYILVNTRIDYQYRSNILDKLCLYDFVSVLYKRKMTAADKKYLSEATEIAEDRSNRRGRPLSKRYQFQNEHPQANTHLIMEHSEPQVPVLFGPQIPRRDREDTRERYCRALLTLFVPWRIVSDLCDMDQTWEEALNSRQSRIPDHCWKIIENIQLLHECKKDRDEHLLQVIAEVQSENDSVEPEMLPQNSRSHEEYEIEDAEDLLELLGQLDEQTALQIIAKDSSERRYIQETVQAVENVGRFAETTSECFMARSVSIDIRIIIFQHGI